MAQDTNPEAPRLLPCGHLTTDDPLACTPECDRINYEADGEPDGCYYCGSPLHKTSDCRQVVFSSAAYNAGYAYASGYHD